MLLHARFPIGLELLHLGLLIGREQLIQFVVNARLLHLHLHQCLRLLRDQSLHLGFVVGAFHVLPELLIHLVNLLHQRFHRGVLFVHHGFHLGALCIGQVQILGEEAHAVAFPHPHAHTHFMPVHGRRCCRICALRLADGSAHHNCQRRCEEP
jgi:hypothetical protein